MQLFALQCSGGLGNRLLGLLSARQRHPLAKIVTYWSTGPFKVTKAGPRLEAQFLQLYEPIDGFQFVGKDEFEKVKSSRGIRFGYSHGMLPGTRAEELWQLAGLLKLAQGPVDIYRHWRSLLPGDYHGCLIRLRGHRETQAWDPRHKFEKLLARLKRPVFVSCDDPGYAKTLHDVYFATKPGRFGSLEQLTVVAAELQLLAEAKSFYAPPCTALAAIIQVLRGQSPQAAHPIGDWSFLKKG